MTNAPLYRTIAEAIRQEILNGRWKPGDRLPSVREMAERWNCTVGTIQSAYRELARQGLITSRPGQGTRVTERLPLLDDAPLRRARLVHRAEAFLLEVLTGGYTLSDVDEAMRQAMDRWRAITRQSDEPADLDALRFSGSHDLAVTWLASHFPEVAPGVTLELTFSGSLGGLIALAEGQADLAGSHLWDEETGEYNLPFIRRILPGRRIGLVTLAHRRLGLILPPGNPAGVRGLEDLTRLGLRFINRQAGSGTRVWLDAALRSKGIDSDQILGFSDEKATHSSVAQAVAEGEADATIGLEGAALSFGLDFLFLSEDRYDLVAPEEIFESRPLQAVVEWLSRPATRRLLEGLGGYDPRDSGQVTWVG